jgi:hypothetical protein
MQPIYLISPSAATAQGLREVYPSNYGILQAFFIGLTPLPGFVGLIVKLRLFGSPTIKLIALRISVRITAHSTDSSKLPLLMSDIS